jgi:indolepyruvate ferredoxin oxidoreductase
MRAPVIVGKTTAQGQPLVSALGELRPSRLIELVAHWLAVHFPDNWTGDHLVRDFTPPELLSNASDASSACRTSAPAARTTPAPRCPKARTAQAGIGCHFMASWMDRDTEGLIQMGGEGVDWVSHAMFTKTPHVFQNLGDGTYYHSGYLAIRQAVAAKATLTYKILFNDAVAMTGGQPVDGVISVDAIARQVEAEGVKQGGGRPTTSTSTTPSRTAFRPAPSSTTAPRSTPCSAACARCRRDRADLRADLRRREAPPPQEGRAGRSAQAPVHQRRRVRRLRRLHRAEQLRGRAAARNADGPQAQDRPDQLQQGLLLRQGLLPQLRGRDRRQAAPQERRAGRRRRDAFLHRVAALPHPAPHAWTAPTTCWSPAWAAPAWSRWARSSRWPRTWKASRPACSTSWASRRRAARC